MMKTFKKSIVSFAMVFLVLFAVACGSNQKGGTSDNDHVMYNGTHVYTAEDTTDYLVKNGACDYTVVLPSNDNMTLNTAKEEFLCLFEYATNVRLRVIYDYDGLNHTASNKFISLGETTLLASANLKVDKLALGTDGGRIITKDQSIYIVGGSDKGTLYAVYTFMQISFNFEQYYKDCFEIDRGVTNYKLKNYNVTDIPDIATRINGTTVLEDTSDNYDVNNFATRMKMGTTMDDKILRIYSEYDNPSSTSAAYHNTSEYLPDAVYAEEHPKWYDGKGQLCYTAHGDEQELQLMMDEMANKVINSLKLFPATDYPYKNIVTVSQEDGQVACTCDGCTQAQLKYGSRSGACVVLINGIRDRVVEWMNKAENAAYRRDDLKFMLMAYTSTVVAPAVQNDEGVWEPAAEEVKMHDGVGVWVACIDNLDYQSSIYDEVNARGKDCLDAWSSLTDNVGYWLYSTNFTAYTYMYDSFNFFNTEGYNYLAGIGGSFLFNQSQTGQSGTMTAWHNLKLYLDSKLSWDCSLDTYELTENWFDAMYRDAAPAMKELYTSMRAWMSKVLDDNNFRHVKSIYQKINQASNWPLNLCKSWLDLCEDAINSIAGYETTQPEIYTSIFYHIGAEYISTAYTVLTNYRGRLTQNELQHIKDRMIDFVKTTGYTARLEGGKDMQTWVDNL